MGDRHRLVIGAVLLICAYLSISQSPGCTRVAATEIQIHQPTTRADASPYARHLGVVARHATKVTGHGNESRGNIEVAGGRIERPSPGNEPGVVPLHQPAQS